MNLRLLVFARKTCLHIDQNHPLGDFALQETFGQVWGLHFHSRAKGCYWYLVSNARNAAERLAKHRTVL